MSHSAGFRVPQAGRNLLFSKTGKLLAIAAAAAGGVALSVLLVSSMLAPQPAPDKVARVKPVSAVRLAAIDAPAPRHRVTVGKPGGVARAQLAANAGFAQQWYNRIEQRHAEPLNSRFEHAVVQAKVSPAKLASLFRRAVMKTNAAKMAKVQSTEPVNERFAVAAAPARDMSGFALAYAEPAPKKASGALAAVSAMAANETPDGDERGLALVSPEAAEALYGTGGDLPEAVPLPGERPSIGAARRARDVEPAGQDSEDAAAPARKPEIAGKPGQQRVALARPENPVESAPREGFGQKLKNLFGSRTRAGNGVAVYDISARKVYMPDGSVLEAHSGIGKMADNPRYTHVKMNGATPPHTYNLKMRESRFHGVEAIRMLPVDGKNPHGRTGLLTHSYLLRGGRAESHGCVAFKDYKQFLAAFKKGKVKQLVVVTGGGGAIARATKKGRAT